MARRSFLNILGVDPSVSLDPRVLHYTSHVRPLIVFGVDPEEVSHIQLGLHCEHHPWSHTQVKKTVGRRTYCYAAGFVLRFFACEDLLNPQSSTDNLVSRFSDPYPPLSPKVQNSIASMPLGIFLISVNVQ